MDEWEESPAPPQQQASGGGGYNRDANSSNQRYNSRSFDNSNRRENYEGNNAARGDRGGNRYSNDRGGDKNNRYQNQGERTNRYQDQGERNNRYQSHEDRSNRYQGGESRENRYQGQGERNNRYQDDDRESRYQDRRPQQSGDRREPHGQYSQNKRPYRNDTNYNSSETMDIDPNHIKFIIGKGGRKIREIESTCNVKLQIDKNDNNVKISGATTDDVNKAIDIIKEVTSSSF